MMYNLVIDIGNSSCKMALVNELELFRSVRCSPTEIIQQIDLLVKEVKVVDNIVVSSVAGKDAALLDEMKKRCRRFIFLDNHTPIPISILYKTPQTLGMDRLACAVGAHILFPDKDVLVFDFGTAITIDMVKKNGDYLGGNISPGLSTRFNAINHYTKQLPLVSKEGEWSGCGGTTQEAIRSGVILGIMFEVEGYIRKHPDNVIVFTGGDAIFFAEKMKNPIFAVCNLVLIGLSYIAVYNATIQK